MPRFRRGAAKIRTVSPAVKYESPLLDTEEGEDDTESSTASLCHIDSDTTVPEDLFFDLLEAAARAKSRGQHCEACDAWHLSSNPICGQPELHVRPRLALSSLCDQRRCISAP